MYAKLGIARFLNVMVLAITLLCVSCSHYSFDNNKPKSMEDINTIHVETFQNNSVYPRYEAMLTNSVVEEMNRSGMYVAGASGESDAVLRGTVKSIGLSQLRSLTYNTYRSMQTRMQVSLSYELVRVADGKVLRKGNLNVRSDYYNQPKQTSSKEEGLSLSARMAANDLLSRLTN